MNARASFNLGLYSAKASSATDPGDLIHGNFGLVRKIAWHVHGRVSTVLEIEELMQIGMIALIEAARTFVDRGQAAFTTYASVRIRGAMIDALRKHANMARSALRRRRELNAARAEITAKLGRPPSAEEFAEFLQISLNELQEQLASTHGTKFDSIEEIYSDHSIWFAADDPDALERLEQKDLKQSLAQAITRLPQREAMVIQLYFVEELNLEEIGQTLGVGAARVCQIKKSALDKIRNMLSDWED